MAMKYFAFLINKVKHRPISIWRNNRLILFYHFWIGNSETVLTQHYFNGMEANKDFPVRFKVAEFLLLV